MPIARILFKFLFITLLILIIIGIFLPSKSLIENSISIQSSSKKIFPYINDTALFLEWSPWNKMGTNSELIFKGKSRGIGSEIFWKNTESEINNGNIEIVESEKNTKTEMIFNFGDKFYGRSTLLLIPESENSTTVIWKIEADFGWDLFSRYAGLLFQKFIGKVYENGLKDLKRKIEIDD